MPSVNKDHLELLTVLHENTKRFDVPQVFFVESIRQELQWNETLFIKTATYLEGHRLVGLTRPPITFANEGAPLPIQGAYLTSLGEDLMIEIENQPGIAQRLTSAVINMIWNTSQSIITQTVSSFFASHV